MDLNGRDMRNARPSQDEFRKWETNFTLSAESQQERFRPLTESNIGNRLAVSLDRQTSPTPLVSRRHHSIEDRRFRPQHRGPEQPGSRVDDLLSDDLRSGFACPRDYWCCCWWEGEFRLAPPPRPTPSVKSFQAGIAGLAAVIIVMLVYCRRSGINAVLALLLNTIILAGRGNACTLRRAHAAGYRRCDFDRWYGGGFQCADFRAYP